MKTGVKRYKEIGRYLVVDPEICHGKLTFKGTRIPVATVLTFLATGDSIESILKNWPRLKREAVEEAIHLAARLVQRRFPTHLEMVGKRNFFAAKVIREPEITRVGVQGNNALTLGSRFLIMKRI